MATTAPIGAAASPVSSARRPVFERMAVGDLTPTADATSATAVPVAATPAAVISGCDGDDDDDVVGRLWTLRRVATVAETARDGGVREDATDGGTPLGKMVRAASLRAASFAAAVPIECAATPDARMPAHMRRPPATLFMMTGRRAAVHAATGAETVDVGVRREDVGRRELKNLEPCRRAALEEPTPDGGSARRRQ